VTAASGADPEWMQQLGITRAEVDAQNARDRAAASGDDRRCPSVCDPDCDATCHEAHQPRIKQQHDPVTCSGADQPTLRDQLAEVARAHEFDPVGRICSCGVLCGVVCDNLTYGQHLADQQLPLIEADRERAEAEAAAEALAAVRRRVVNTVDPAQPGTAVKADCLALLRATTGRPE